MTSERPIPPAINQLRLVWAFKDYNPGILDCIEISDESQIMLVDDTDGTHISYLEEDIHRCCLCINPQNCEIIILPLDKKLIKQRKGGMADGAAFSERKFAFIEFKDQAQGNTQIAVEETYTKAINQLSAALKLFVDKLRGKAIDFTKKLNVVCHIIVSEKFPRIRALEQSLMLEFAMSNNGIELSFENEIVFP